MFNFRTSLTSKQRATELSLQIDPGFVHHRTIQALIGEPGMAAIDAAISRLPETDEWLRSVRIDHIYSEAFLAWCSAMGVGPLDVLLQDGSLGSGEVTGHFFCSTERLDPCESLYDVEEATSVVRPRLPTDYSVALKYMTAKVKADTLRSKLAEGFEISVVAELELVEEKELVFRPRLMGFPILKKPSPVELGFEPMVLQYNFFEHFVEDFDEFAKVRDAEEPPSPEPMRHVSEAAFKQCLAELLGDQTSKDWGGETSDYYSAHVRLNGRRHTAAFLLKGPAKFGPMGLNHLGKNNNQIVRLASEPADVLVVQHCHDIGSDVRATLRAFAVQPGRPRRYCLIDGRDSLRLLRAYDLYEKAQELSKSG